MQKIVIKSYESKKNLVTPVLFFIVGLILFLNPSGVVNFISYIFGGVFLALGIGKYVADNKRIDKTTGDTFYSVVMIILGVIFIFFSGAIEFLIRLAIGLWIIVNAINTIAIGANLAKLEKKAVVTLIIGFILLLMGLYTILVENLVLSTLGLVILIYAILEIIDYFYIQSKNR